MALTLEESQEVRTWLDQPFEAAWGYHDPDGSEPLFDLAEDGLSWDAFQQTVAQMQFPELPEDLSVPHLFVSDQEHARILLLRAFDAAKYYDGSRTAHRRLNDSIALHQNFVTAREGSGSTEMQLKFANLVFPDHPNGMPLTSFGFFGLASKFYDRLKEAETQSDLINLLEHGGATVIAENYTFVRNSEGVSNETRDTVDAFPYIDRLQPRLAMLIENLRKAGSKDQGIYLDDLVIRTGQIDPNGLADYPYNIVQIPRLNVEIALCDHGEEITYVKKGTVGPEFWDFMTDETLKGRDDIQRIRASDEGLWLREVADALSNYSSPGDNVNVKEWTSRAQNLDMDLVRASLLAHHLATGDWLTESMKSEGGEKGSYILEHGPYAGLINVKDLANRLLYDGNSRGLQGSTTIAKLNEEISEAYDFDYFNHMNKEALKYDLIKETLLAHYQATGHWLTRNDRTEGGNKGSYVLEHGPYAGQLTVGALDKACRKDGGRGLPGSTTLAKLKSEIRAELEAADDFEAEGPDLPEPI